MTCDTWYVTCETGYVTCDMWWGVNILSKCQLPSFNGLGFIMFWRLGGKGWSNYWQRCFKNSPGYNMSVNYDISLRSCTFLLIDAICPATYWNILILFSRTLFIQDEEYGDDHKNKSLSSTLGSVFFMSVLAFICCRIQSSVFHNLEKIFI